MNLKQLLKSRKLKHGSLSVIFTAAFIMLIIAINLILTSVAAKGNLTIDLTKEELYSIGDETKAVLQTLGDDFDITIYFFADRDRYESSRFSLMVRDLGEEYARLYPQNVTVVYKDANKDPAFVERFLSETQTAITTNHVVVEGKYHHRVLSLNAFFITSEDTGAYYAFNGENRYTAAILQCSIEEPQIVTFTTGHDETTSPSMLDIFHSAGFEIKFTDLATEDIDPRTRILIISNPRYDFLGYDGEESGTTEIEKVADYVNEFKNLIVLVNSSTPELPNLQEYLYEYWGLGYKPYHKINDMVNSLSIDGFSIRGQYVGSEGTSAAYNIHSVASSEGSGARTAFRNAVELFSDSAKAKRGAVIEQVIKTYPTARSFYMDEEENEVSRQGEFPLMLLSTYMDYGDNNVRRYQYVLLASDTFLAAGYGNRKVVLGAARVMSTERVSPNIGYKPFVKEALTIVQGTANTLTWLVSGILPLIIIILGLVVFFKRRHL